MKRSLTSVQNVARLSIRRLAEIITSTKTTDLITVGLLSMSAIRSESLSETEDSDARIVRRCSHCNRYRLFERNFEMKKFVVCEDCRKKRSIRRRLFRK